MQTMFVQDSCSASTLHSSTSSSSPPRNPFPHAAKPLLPLQCNVLAASESCLHLPPMQPPDTYESPLHKQFRGVLAQASQGCLFGGQNHPPAPQLQPSQWTSSDFSSPTRPSQRIPYSPPSPSPSKLRGLGFGLDAIGARADMATLSSNNKPGRKGTFQAQSTQKGTNSWQLKQFAEATLGSGSLRKVVKLPQGEDRDEWLAVNGTSLPRGSSHASEPNAARSRGFLQPDQSSIRRHHRVLQPTNLSRNESHRRVRHYTNTPNTPQSSH